MNASFSGGFWSGRTALVTGASSGIGAALARDLGVRGARVGLLARRADLLEQVAADIEEQGGWALTLPADVCNRKQVRAAVDRLAAAAGPVEVLVANAGRGAGADLKNLDAARVADVFNVNVLGAIHCLEAVLPPMLERRAGRVAVVSSLAALLPLPAAAYAASKVAVARYFESLAPGLRSRGVTVTVLYPGFVRTSLTTRNRFPMPFSLEAAAAAREICRAVERGRPRHLFPWQMALLTRAGRLLPAGLLDRYAAGRR